MYHLFLLQPFDLFRLSLLSQCLNLHLVTAALSHGQSNPAGWFSHNILLTFNEYHKNIGLLCWVQILVASDFKLVPNQTCERLCCGDPEQEAA